MSGLTYIEKSWQSWVPKLVIYKPVCQDEDEDSESDHEDEDDEDVDLGNNFDQEDNNQN